MIKAVFLDVDNTLLDFDSCGMSAMRRGFEEFGFPFEESMYHEIFHRINTPLWEMIERNEFTREGLFKVRWTLIFRALGINADGPAFEKRFLELLETAAVPVTGAPELISYLENKYILCAASNAFYKQQLKRLTLAGMAPHFQHIFVSEQLGANKPHTAFFNACLSSLPGIRADECVMIGDSLTADIAGGSNAGMQTIWFNHDHIAVPSNCRASCIVDSLDEIRKIL